MKANPKFNAKTQRRQKAAEENQFDSRIAGSAMAMNSRLTRTQDGRLGFLCVLCVLFVSALSSVR